MPSKLCASVRQVGLIVACLSMACATLAQPPTLTVVARSSSFSMGSNSTGQFASPVVFTGLSSAADSGAFTTGQTNMSVVFSSVVAPGLLDTDLHAQGGFNGFGGCTGICCYCGPFTSAIDQLTFTINEPCVFRITVASDATFVPLAFRADSRVAGVGVAAGFPGNITNLPLGAPTLPTVFGNRPHVAIRNGSGSWLGVISVGRYLYRVQGSEEQNMVLPEGSGTFSANVSGRFELVARCTTITEQPQNQSACLGGAAALRFGVKGHGPFTARWLRNGVAVMTQTIAADHATFVLPFTNIQGVDFATYQCLVTTPVGLCTDVGSNIVTVSERSIVQGCCPTPTILDQPDAQTACLGGSATLSFVVTAPTSPTYQWFRNGVAVRDTDRIFGARSPTLSIVSGTIADGGFYYCRADFECTVLTSAMVSVTFRYGGICCLPDGTCFLPLDGCTCGTAQYINGLHFPTGVGTCSPSPCPGASIPGGPDPEPHGGCCFAPTGECLTLTVSQCALAGGTMLPEGMTCETVFCPTPTASCRNDVTGACVPAYDTCRGGLIHSTSGCNPDPDDDLRVVCCTESGCSCCLVDILDCSLLGLTMLGAPCDPANCAEDTVGICCTPTNCTPLPSNGHCVAGTLVLGISGCTPDPCRYDPPGGLEPAGVCCRGVTCAITFSVQGCAGVNTLLVPYLRTCNQPDDSTRPCCKADFNHLDGVDIQDIFDFLNAWFAANPFADFTNNGLDLQDIFDFLNAWFAGC